MPAGYWIFVTIHVLAALLWLGGMFFLAVVGAPVLRKIEPAALRQQLFSEIGIAFRRVGWIALSILVASGTVLLYYRGFLRWEGVFGDAGFWSTGTGTALAWKLGAVTAMLLIQGTHDFVLGPAASRAVPGSPEALGLRRRAALLARGGALLGLVIVLAAVRLARGG